MNPIAPKHPAPFSVPILEYLNEVVPPGTFLDPFCGVGRVFELERDDRHFYGIEIETEWGMQAQRVAPEARRVTIGDALFVMHGWRENGYLTRPFTGIVTSPVYGNRMSDSHNAKDDSRRRSYTHFLHRKVSEGSIADAYFWQPRYKEFHYKAWYNALQCTRLDGHMFLNVKNFIRNRRVMNVVGWHMKALKKVGWTVVGKVEIATPGFREGENWQARVESEAVVHAVRMK